MERPPPDKLPLLHLAWLLGLKLGSGLVGIWIAMMTDEWLRGLRTYRRWKKRSWIAHAERSRARVIGGADSWAPVWGFAVASVRRGGSLEARR